jgi:hypothetical protein
MRFGMRRRSTGTKDAAIRLMLQARAILDCDDDEVVSVSEHDCADSACRGSRTVVLVLRPGWRTEAARIDKALGSVTPGDLAEALAAVTARRRASETSPT